MSRPDISAIDGGNPVEQQATAWFVRLRADDASERDRQAWQQWLHADPGHRAAYGRIEALWSSLGDFAAAPELATRVPRPRVAPRRAPRPRRWLAAAAAATVLACATGMAFLLLAPAAVESAYRTGIGERRSLQLEDGTRVDLDADTRVQVRYDHRGRHVRLDGGRAFFRVARDSERPFLVQTSAGSVRALGTRFEVSRLGNAADVTLYEGSVELQGSADAARPAARLGVLVPGQRARMADQRMQVTDAAVAAGSAPGWLSGRLVFNDTPLPEAVAEFGRYSFKPVLLADPGLASYRVSGVFRGEDVEGFIQALGEVYGIPEHHTADGSHVLGNAP
ncbi:FecR family protein [Stenotrophomonas nitritireducens]|uniref:FecR family protein n=1 Tax=Stenotrophomonas nitritireducens TaxID=83617 RepID=UPI003D996DE7